MRCRVVYHPAPQGSKRHVGNGVLVEMAGKRLVEWRKAVKAEAEVYADEPLTGPVVVRLRFHMRSPINVPADREGFPTVPPDLDKLVRSTLDALTGPCFKDDAQVVSIRAEKVYALNPEDEGAEIQVLTWSDAA